MASFLLLPTLLSERPWGRGSSQSPATGYTGAVEHAEETPSSGPSPAAKGKCLRTAWPCQVRPAETCIRPPRPPARLCPGPRAFSSPAALRMHSGAGSCWAHAGMVERSPRAGQRWKSGCFVPRGLLGSLAAPQPSASCSRPGSPRVLGSSGCSHEASFA